MFGDTYSTPTVERDRDPSTDSEETLTDHDILQLSESEELSILTGNKDADIGETGSSLADLEETLLGYQQNSEQRRAWIRTLVPPDADTLPDSVPTECRTARNRDEVVLIEFMLPSRDMFWEAFILPEQRWPESNDFIQLLDTINVSPGSLSDALGSELDVVPTEDGWQTDVTAEQSPEERRKDALFEWVIAAKKKMWLHYTVGGAVASLLSAAAVAFSPVDLLFSLTWILLSWATVCWFISQQWLSSSGSTNAKKWQRLFSIERQKKL